MVIEAEELKSLIKQELRELNFDFNETGNLVLPDDDKDTIRSLHASSRQIELENSQEWIKKALEKYQNFFASGVELTPKKIKPLLILVTEKWQHDLFRLARYTWALPYSQGFGRRMRYLIIDDCNEKLIGIFALQSPPIGFPARDKLFDYPEGRKTELVNQTMDIHTLGALPPYGRLLGGKLAALATISNEVRQDYKAKYSGRITEMEKRELPANLVALTTTSAFGRSSIYNRLKYNGEVVAKSIGYTEGFGSFHLMKLYPLFKEYLESEGVDIKGGYGTGPRRKWQIMRSALESLDLPGDLLNHGVKREAFLFPLVHNLKDYLEGKEDEPEYRNLPFAELVEYWRERWLLPRSTRVDGWHKWDNNAIAQSIILTKG
ncbi:MAG: DUF4338 domain-containing protein [Ardenticatenaceae bacterium]|nr:DUF4338 domain-containing protein [Ardenticatenaceae bacterium]